MKEQNSTALLSDQEISPTLQEEGSYHSTILVIFIACIFIGYLPQFSTTILFSIFQDIAVYLCHYVDVEQQEEEADKTGVHEQHRRISFGKFKSKVSFKYDKRSKVVFLQINHPTPSESA